MVKGRDPAGYLDRLSVPRVDLAKAGRAKSKCHLGRAKAYCLGRSDTSGSSQCGRPRVPKSPIPLPFYDHASRCRLCSSRSCARRTHGSTSRSAPPWRRYERRACCSSVQVWELPVTQLPGTTQTKAAPCKLPDRGCWAHESRPCLRAAGISFHNFKYFFGDQQAGP